MNTEMLQRLLKYFKIRTKNIKIGKYELVISKDHLLPSFLNKFPHYSKNIGRLSKATKEKYKDLRIIDVGSNIGDTVAIIRNEIDAKIICFEGNKEYYELLKINTRGINDIDLYDIYLGDDDKEIIVGSISNFGTSFLNEKITSKNRRKVNINKLDSFLKNHIDYKGSKILKIDTDGFDLKIIKGATNFINSTKPIIFFELDKELFEDNFL